MTEHKKEALDTMMYEHANREYYVLFTVGEIHYIVATMEYFDEPRRADIKVALNKEHKQMISECLEFLGTGESLCDLSTKKDHINGG